MKLIKVVIFVSSIFSCVFAHANDDALCDPNKAKQMLMDSFTSAATIDMERDKEFRARVNAIDGGSKAKGSSGSTFTSIVLGDKKVMELQSKRAPIVLSFLQGLGELGKQGYADCKKAKELHSLTNELRSLAEMQWSLIDSKFSAKYPKKIE